MTFAQTLKSLNADDTLTNREREHRINAAVREHTPRDFPKDNRVRRAGKPVRAG